MATYWVNVLVGYQVKIFADSKEEAIREAKQYVIKKKHPLVPDDAYVGSVQEDFVNYEEFK